jgi:phosphopantetheinyl transferase
MIVRTPVFDILDPLPSLENETVLALMDMEANPGLAGAGRTHLTRRERREIEGTGAERLRAGRLAARVCLKESLARRGWIQTPGDCEVGRDERGRPRLALRVERGAGLPPDCSLSHSGRWALSAWTCVPGLRVGADLEARSARWAERRAAVRTADDDDDPELAPADRAAVLWTLKEAAAKALGSGLGGALDCAVRREDGTLCRIEAGGGRVLAGRYRVGPGWVLAVAWWKERSHSCLAN